MKLNNKKKNQVGFIILIFFYIYIPFLVQTYDQESKS